MFQVETVLNMLKPIIPSMSAEEKSQLLEELKKLLKGSSSDAHANAASQNQSNTVSNVSFDGGGNNAMNFSPVQNSSGNVEVFPNFEQTTSSKVGKFNGLPAFVFNSIPTIQPIPWKVIGC